MSNKALEVLHAANALHRKELEQIDSVHTHTPHARSERGKGEGRRKREYV